MRPAELFNGNAQPLFWPDNHPTMRGWFKGMEQLIKKRGQWPWGGLKAHGVRAFTVRLG